jgi:hypothetical protein
MSKSYKKIAIFKDKAHKNNKRWANKRIRKFIKSVEVGFKSINFFHKLYNSWDISDWKIKSTDRNFDQELLEKSKRK